MATHSENRPTLKINRAPVLTLWAAVVAQRLGLQWEEALTLGRAVAGLNAYAKGKALGLFVPTPKGIKEQHQALRGDEQLTVELLHRAVPVRQTAEGLRALSGGKLIDPASVQRYLESKFGDAFQDTYEAMRLLAKSKKPAELLKKLLINCSGHPLEQDANHAELDHGFTICCQPLIISAMTAIIEQPRKAAFHRPAPRHHLNPLARVAGDLQGDFMRLLPLAHPLCQPLRLLAAGNPQLA